MNDLPHVKEQKYYPVLVINITINDRYNYVAYRMKSIQTFLKV